MYRTRPSKRELILYRKKRRTVIYRSQFALEFIRPDSRIVRTKIFGTRNMSLIFLFFFGLLYFYTFIPRAHDASVIVIDFEFGRFFIVAFQVEILLFG